MVSRREALTTSISKLAKRLLLRLLHIVVFVLENLQGLSTATAALLNTRKPDTASGTLPSQLGEACRRSKPPTVAVVLTEQTDFNTLGRVGQMLAWCAVWMHARLLCLVKLFVGTIP